MSFQNKRVCPICENYGQHTPRKGFFYSQEAPFRCTDNHCRKEPDTVYATYRNIPPVAMGHVIQPDQINWWSRMFPQSYVECSICHRKTSVRLCPDCHYELGPDVPNKTIIIIGAASVGKTVYIAVLIHEFMQKIGSAFHVGTTIVGQAARGRLNERYFGPLYHENPPRLPVPDLIRDAEKLKEPISCRLSFSSGPSLLLSFHDSAGESMLDVSDMQYITNAQGIILLLDPLQIEAVRKALAGTTLPVMNFAATPQAIITQLHEVYVRQAKIHPDQKISIPIAITFSKIDRLQGLIPAGDPLRQNSRQNGHFNQDDADAVNLAMSDLLNKWLPGFIVTANSLFENYRLFGVSSLGDQPATNGTIHRLNPLRVADPLLWLLRSFRKIS